MWETRSPQDWLKQVAESPEKIPNTFSNQDKLPRLPVPDLNETLDKYLEVVLPVVTEAEFETTKKLVNEFRNGQGKILQARLLAHEEDCKKKGVTNWLKDWWLYGAYLSDRVPIAINSNVYAVSRDHPLAVIQAIDPVIRASGVANHMAISVLLHARGQIPIDFGPGKKPFCMDQHTRVYSTVRVPGEQVDHLVTYPLEKSRHVAVLIREHFFYLEIIDDKLQPRSAKDILFDMEDLVAFANSQPVAAPISVFTYQDRTFWAKARAKLVQHSAQNAASIEGIESCITVIVFDDNSPKTNDESAHLSLNGEGRMRYFDKSAQAIFFANGRMGNNAEHTPYDAPPTAHHGFSFITALETAEEYIGLSNVHRWDHKWNSDKQPKTKTWWHLPIEVPPSVADDLTIAIPKAVAYASSSDIKLLEYPKYGMHFIRNLAKQSPDSWVQMGLQAAYYRLTGTCTAVYETQTTRSFRDGRTETGRPLSVDQVKFVKIFHDSKSSAIAKYAALAQAIGAHVKYMNEAGLGKGMDRHLLGLRFCVQPNEEPPKFLSDVAWAKCNNFMLSTSNMTPGTFWAGGFGAYLHDGYGCCYGIRPHAIWVSIASRTTSGKTSSELFRKTLYQVFDDMYTMAVEASAAAAKKGKAQL